VTEAANILRVARPTLSSLLNAKADLSSDMALRFEKAFGVDMETLMRMKNSFDIAQTAQQGESHQG
jgi:addiction module HigA family antidote